MMDNRGETQSKPVNFINRKLAALTVAGTILIGGAGCTEANTVDTSTIIPTSVENTIKTFETTKLVTPEITITPTEAPTATPTPEVKTDEALLAEAGTLDGADTVIKVINGVKIPVYVAKENNAYEVKAGTELGQYYKNVEFEGTMVGAKVCIPEVVKVLYENKLAENPEGESNWVIFVPADISEVKNRDSKIVVEVINSIHPDYKVEKSGLKVSFGGEEVSISNPIVDWENQGFNNTVDTGFFTYPNFLGGIINMDGNSGIVVIGNFKFDGPVMNHEVKFGTKIMETSDPIYVMEYNSPLDTLEKIEDKNVLMNEGKIVFMIDEGTMEKTTTETSN